MWLKFIIILLIFVLLSFLSHSLLLEHYPNNDFTEKFILPILGSIFGFIAAYFLIRYKDDNEIVKSHFDDLKKLVIIPIINIIQDDITKLPSIDSINKYHKPSNNKINYFLCIDLLNNHYPKIITAWNTALESIERLKKDKETIRHTIEDDVKNIVVGLKSDPNSLKEWKDQEDELNKFKQHLTSDLVNGVYNEDKIQVTKLRRLVYPYEDEIDPNSELDMAFGPIGREIALSVS